jgi:hypothetical protein
MPEWSLIHIGIVSTMRSILRKFARKGLCSSRPTFLVTAVLLGLGIIIWTTTAPEPKRMELKRMRAELRANGEALSEKELVARVPRLDLFEPFTNAANRLDKLRSDRLLALMNYASNGVVRPMWRMEQPVLRYLRDTYSPSLTWQECTEVMEQAEPVLRQVRAIPTKPLANHGLGRKAGIFGMIVLSQWLTESMVVDLHREDPAAALENLEAGIALAEVSRDEPDLIWQIGRSAVITITIRATWEALQYPGWTDPELCRLQAAWELVTPLRVAELGLKGELAMGSDYDEAARQLPSDEPLFTTKRLLWPFYLMFEAPADQLFCLSYRWDELQIARALGRHEPWAVLKPQAQSIQSGVFKLINSSSRHWIPRFTLPKIQEILENSVRSETARQLLLADIAIRRFKLRHNDVAPESLAELSPDFLRSPSCDPMTGNPLLYRPGVEGTYLLYSAGEDGLDDGGDLTPINGNPPGLWNAKDIVWPTSACPPESP